MTDYEILHFLDNSITIDSAGTTDYINFYYEDTSYVQISEDVSATTNVGWLAIDDVDQENRALEVTFEPNTGNTSRQGKIYIKTNVQYPDGYRSIDDYITIVQAGHIAGTGSISAQTGTNIILAGGDTGTISFILTNCDTSTLQVSPDNDWSGDFSIDGMSSTGFTYTARENSSNDARTVKVQISAKMVDADEYAYAYVRLMQPSVNDLGHFVFEEDTVSEPYYAVDDSMYFEVTHVSAITATYSSEYQWLSGWTTNWQYDVQEDKLVGDLLFWLSANTYNFPRTGYLTLEGTSLIDGSTVKGHFYVEQAANTTGHTQTAFIYCTETEKTLSTPDATTVTFYDITYSNSTVKSQVQIDSRQTIGNFETGYPQLGPTKDFVNVNLKATTSTTDWTYSQIALTSYDGNGPSNTLYLTIAQPPYVEMLEFPIWRDEDVRIDSEYDYVDYIITTGSTTIYNGRAYTLGGSCTIRLNDILNNFLKPVLNVTVEGLQDRGCYLNAMLKVKVGGEYQNYKRIKCYYDWSYKQQYSDIISKPLSKTLDKRQLLLCTVKNNDGEMLGVELDIKKGGTYLFDGYDVTNDVGTVVLGVYDTDEITVYAGGTEITYKIEDTCKRYCLYYLNASGGWDTYLFENTSKETDNFTRSTYKKNINNQTHQFGKVEYKNKIVKSWVLKTDYITDEQSLNLAENMVGSTQAYLHDFEENKIYPVVVTSKKSDYLTFKKNGRKMVRYDVNVELAQDRKRL